MPRLNVVLYRKIQILGEMVAAPSASSWHPQTELSKIRCRRMFIDNNRRPIPSKRFMLFSVAVSIR